LPARAAKLEVVTRLEDLASACVIIEAIVENIEVKKTLFQSARGHHRRRLHPRHQHLLAVSNLDRRRLPAARSASAASISSIRCR
jgi:hypothetical protein